MPTASDNLLVPSTSASNQAAVAWSVRIARLLGGFVFLGGFTGLLGWVLDIRRLTDWEDNGISIQPNNTVLMMLGGLAVILIASGRGRLGSYLGVAAGAVGFATFSQYLHGVDLGIDRLLLMGREWGAAGTVVHGRMGPPAGLSWTILGVAFFLLAAGSARVRRLVPFLVLVVLLIASLSFTGYMFGADVLYTLPRLTVIAWQTSAFFIALAIGLLAAMPDLRPVSLVTEDTVTGMLTRWLILPVVVIPLALGALRIAGQNAGLYDTAMGTAVLNVILIAVFLLILFYIGAISSRFERDKLEADRSAFATAAELAEREQRLAGILDSVTDGFYSLDSEWRFAFVNDHIVERFQMPRDEIIGANIWELFPDAVGSTAYVGLERAMRERVLVEYEIFYEPWQLWFFDKAAPTADGGLAVYTSDITERKRIEESLAHESRQREFITDAVPALISYIDNKFCYQFNNKAYEKWFGRPAEELRGKHMRDVLGEAAFERVRPHAEAALSGKRLTFEQEVPYKDGGTRYIHADYVPDIREDGTVAGYYALISDITQIKQSYQAMRDSEERFRSVFDKAAVSIWVEDFSCVVAAIDELRSKGVTDFRAYFKQHPEEVTRIMGLIRVLDVNDATITMFEAADKAELIGALPQIFAPVSMEDFIGELITVAEGRRYYETQSLLNTVRGNSIHTFFTMSLPEPGNPYQNTIFSVHDISKVKLAEQALADLNRELEERVNARTEALGAVNVALAEEMNARVAAEQERIAVLSRMMTAQEDERRRIAVELHDQLGQHMTALRLRLNALSDKAGDSELSVQIEQIIRIAEDLDQDIDAVTLSLRPRSLDTLGLSEALGQYVATWQRQSGIAADFHAVGYREGLLAPEAETALFRITQEALHNCAKHSAAGLVNVLLGVRDGRLRLVIEDDGEGFDVNKLHTNGDGLGLTSMRERCELVGGELTIESENSTGTTILVTIPMNDN